MRVKYKNITSDGTITLLTKGGEKGVYGQLVSYMKISNHDNSSKNIVNLFLYDGTNTYVILETVIPARTCLVLQGDEVKYDGKVYDLKITTDDDGGTTNMTVIIK